MRADAPIAHALLALSAVELERIPERGTPEWEAFCEAEDVDDLGGRAWWSRLHTYIRDETHVVRLWGGAVDVCVLDVRRAGQGHQGRLGAQVRPPQALMAYVPHYNRRDVLRAAGG